MMLTAEDLALMGTCKTGVETFRGVFGNGGAALTWSELEIARCAFDHHELCWLYEAIGFKGNLPMERFDEFVEDLKATICHARGHYLKWMYPGDPIFDPLAEEVAA